MRQISPSKLIMFRRARSKFRRIPLPNTLLEIEEEIYDALFSFSGLQIQSDLD
jgi:hypothetical protein